LPTAFALGHLHRINGFHPYPKHVVGPDPPYWSLPGSAYQYTTWPCCIILCCRFQARMNPGCV